MQTAVAVALRELTSLFGVLGFLDFRAARCERGKHISARAGKVIPLIDGKVLEEIEKKQQRERKRERWKEEGMENPLMN